jgi:quinol monooxygenase YgiN
MKPVTVINQIVIKPGKMDEFLEAQRGFAVDSMTTPKGLIGSRMYRGVDGTTAILVSQFASMTAWEEVRQHHAFKNHLSKLQPLVESSSPTLCEEAYTARDFH